MHVASTPPPVSSPNRRYVRHTLAWMGLYLLVHVAAILGSFDAIVGRPAGWAVALAAALPVAGQVRATLRLMADSDEYVRAVVARCFILASGATMVLWTAWGFGESYAGAPHVAGWLLYPVFWAVYAAVAPLVWRRHG